MELGSMGALTGTLIGQPPGGPWRGPLTRTRHQRHRCVQSAPIALNDAAPNGPPPVVAILEPGGLAESAADRLHLTDNGAVCADPLRCQHAWAPGRASKSSRCTRIIV